MWLNGMIATQVSSLPPPFLEHSRLALFLCHRAASKGLAAMQVAGTVVVAACWALAASRQVGTAAAVAAAAGAWWALAVQM